MGVTGLIYFGYVIVHMAGNLQFFLGRDAFDSYGAAAKSSAALLWGVRLLLLASVVLHVVAAAQLSLASRAARPGSYERYRPVQATYASRSMLLGGLVLLCFLVFHILHLTTGQAHPDFREGLVFDNVVAGFRVVPVALGYLVAMIALGLHLSHGAASLTRSLGFSHPRYSPAIRRGARIFAVVLALGFSSLPLAVLAGLGG